MNEKRTYTMTYECLNCGKKKFKEIPFGESVPSLDEDEVCTYCGTRYFSHSKRPKVTDYMDMEESL